MEVHAAPGDELAQLRARYLRAQLAGDLDDALRLLIEDGVHRGMSVPALQRGVLREAQLEIGRLWQENQISVAQEHMATAISNTALSYLYEAASRAPSNGKRVLVSCVEGELHEFPARLVADGLDLAGFEVHYLGANVSQERLLEAVAAEQPDLVALSATMSFNLSALQNAVRTLRESADKQLPIMVGGAACSSSGVELDADASATEVADVIHTAKQLVGISA